MLTLVKDALKTGNIRREARWTQSIAVGEKRFVNEINKRLGSKTLGRKIQPLDDGFQLREGIMPYITDFEAKNSDTTLGNTYNWEVFSNI